MIDTNAHSSMDQRIDSIRVSESERQAAKETMRDADRFAELIYRATDKLRSAEGLLGRLFMHRAHYQ